jgi:hexosaminidase
MRRATRRSAAFRWPGGWLSLKAAGCSNILREVAVLFHTGMVHLGGDEVSFGSGSWSSDSGVLRLTKQEKLGNLTSVEHYFFRRMADSARTLFRTVLAWDEATDASLPPDSTVIFWRRQDKPQQLEKALKGGY